MVAMAAPGGLVWPRLITGTPGGSLGGEEPLWPTSSAFGGPGEAGFGGGAGTGLGAHTILAFSVMVGPTSAWASGGHMDPEGVLTCGRKEASGERGIRSHPPPLAQQSPQMGRRLEGGGSSVGKGRCRVGPETTRTWEGGQHKDRRCPLRFWAALSSGMLLLSCL